MQNERECIVYKAQRTNVNIPTCVARSCAHESSTKTACGVHSQRSSGLSIYSGLSIWSQLDNIQW